MCGAQGRVLQSGGEFIVPGSADDKKWKDWSNNRMGVMFMRTPAKMTSLLLAAAASGIGVGPVCAQEARPAAKDNNSTINEIIVTARRAEERLQDVPISITVFTQEDLASNNVQSAKDIATYTPGLSTNNRYGADNTTWTIRGFTQEQRTTSTVGTYFADVVAPRGSGATQGGDGAGPGALFDLQNVQVLKGPQGTLFGRNSTGGAVLLVPRKPTDVFEGYVEGSAGDYGMYRGQGVINVPFGEGLRVRVGVDRNQRDGYLKNAGRIGSGPNGDEMGSVDYVAARVSVVADLTPNLENYTIASYSKSEATGTPPKIVKCYPAAGANGIAACNQMAREAPLGFWSVSNPIPDALSNAEQWQIVNTTTWQTSDALTVKNIASYGEFEGDTNLDLFGFYQPIVIPGTETSGNDVKPFNTTHALPGHHTNAQSSLVEEFQLRGRAFAGRLVWQGGLYYESNKPLGISGIQSTTLTPCSDISSFNCVPLTNGANSLGRLSYSTTRNEFEGRAAYFQSSYDLTDQFTLTGGIRYTEDTMESEFQINAVTITTNPPGNNVVCTNTPTFGAVGSATNPRLPIDQRFDICKQKHEVETSAPTWLLGMDYTPSDDLLLYAKWSRGYRQGGVASFGADRLQDYDAEEVDTYEVGGKTSWFGALPGYFNLAAFYNDFRDQQLQIGLACIPTALCSQTTAILNAGKSRLSGYEVEAGLTPFEGLQLEAAYAYLDTKVEEIDNVVPIIAAAGLPFTDIRPTPVGSPIPNAIPHKVTAGANYTLPLPEFVGKLTIGGTYIYQSEYRAVTDAVAGSNNGVLPSANWVNLNLTWEEILGMPLDASAFVTNVNNKKIYLHVNDQQSIGFVSYFIGEPRMYGLRLRYKFGG